MHHRLNHGRSLDPQIIGAAPKLAPTKRWNIEVIEMLVAHLFMLVWLCCCLPLLSFTSGVPGLWKPQASTRAVQTLTQRVGGQQEAFPHLQPGGETHHCCRHQPGPTGKDETACVLT